MLRFVATVALAFHGLIHLIGFAVPWGLLDASGQMRVWSDGTWRLAVHAGVPVLGGSAIPGDPAARALGLVWLVLGAAFLTTAVGIWRARFWATPLAAGLATISCVLCVLGLPDTAAGIGVNVGILAAAGLLTAQHQRSVAR